MAELWKRGLKPVKSYELRVKSCLLLGVGGGSVIPILRKYFPDALVTAVEIDPVIVEVGRKYFGLGNYRNLEVVTDDAFDFVHSTHYDNTYYRSGFDLALVDIYAGSEIPKKIKSTAFLKNISRCLIPHGIVVFNHIHDEVIHHNVDRFEKRLRSIFINVTYVDVLVNRLFICSIFQ